MEIEIPEPGRMTQSGSSLLRLLQNNDMPILDLLIRESLQNSLDAGLGYVKSVNVHFLTGKFDSAAFSDELHGISAKLRNRYPEREYNFLAIRDSNTAGLTGPMNYKAIQHNQYGNLMKLVYEISKPQEQEGAGGSWGLGKTVYFRVGMGMVLYYSRIRQENNGFQSRLAVTLVEDESSPNALLPKQQGLPSRGIAWWGRKTGENATEPLTDVAEINRIIGEFGIKPYQNMETGTTVVIPYIQPENLLDNNAIEHTDADGNEKIPYWRNSIEEYLRIAIQRWYTPRLNNVNYPYGKFLRAYINDEPIKKDSMEQFFRIEQALYNRAVGKNEDDDILLENSKCGEIPIAVRSVLDGNSVIGKIAYAQVARKELQMDPPYNKPSPYNLANIVEDHGEGNAPIFCFTRKPGMIVNYVCNGDWADGIPRSDSDHYIIAIFVLDSTRKFTPDLKCSITVEEYFRKCEMADHTSWHDWGDAKFNPRLVTKVQSQARKKLSAVFTPQQDQTEKHEKSGLGKLFGDMLLPPQNFGKKPSFGDSNKDNGNEQKSGKRKSVSLYYDEDATIYHQNDIEVHLRIRGGKHFKSAEVLLGVNTNSGIISAHSWIKQLGLTMPFVISNVMISYNTPKKENYCEHNQILSDTCDELAGTIFRSEILNPDGEPVGIQITGDGLHSLDAEVSLTIGLRNRKEMAVFYLGEVQEAGK